MRCRGRKAPRSIPCRQFWSEPRASPDACPRPTGIRSHHRREREDHNPERRVFRYLQCCPAGLWRLNLQTRYDLEVAEDEIAAKVERDVQPLETVTAPK